MGEETKEENKSEEKKEEVKKKDEEKKKESTTKEEEDKNKKDEAVQEPAETEPEEIVLKVDMHCEACARKVARALKGFQGVEKVTADCKASKVVVKGKVAAADPIKVCQRIQKKTGRKVELISPIPKPKPPSQDTNNTNVCDNNNNKAAENKEDESKGEKKDEPPAVITVVLNVRMHCEPCAQVLQKRIRKIKGVESVTTDIANHKVLVKGVLDPDKLVSDVYRKTRKQASIVKEEEKKEEEKKDEEKKEEKQEDDKKQEVANKEEEDKKADIKKSEYYPSSYNYMEYAYAYPPQLFSDENPNACAVM